MQRTPNRIAAMQQIPPTRQNDSLLAPLESRALAWLAVRMPEWVTPNLLTGLGFVGAVMAAAGYAASSSQPALLWVATLGLAVNWFGDSLDGTLARFRRIERPRYGFFLDQNTDALEQLIFGVGLGLSGFIRFELVLLGLAAYLMLSQQALIRAHVSGVFALSKNGIGLTEWRIGFVILNAVMYFVPPSPINVGVTTTYPNVVAAIVIASMVVSFVGGLFGGLRALRADEPGRQASRRTGKKR
jgi:phosphatidylglycerophosphate synthase